MRMEKQPFVESMEKRERPGIHSSDFENVRPGLRYRNDSHGSYAGRHRASGPITGTSNDLYILWSCHAEGFAVSYPAAQKATCDAFRMAQEGLRQLWWPLPQSAKLTETSCLWRHATAERGSSFMASAISVPLLLILLIGYFQPNLALNSGQPLPKAAGETALWAAMRSSASYTSIPSRRYCYINSAGNQSDARNLDYPATPPKDLIAVSTLLNKSGTAHATRATCDGQTRNRPGDPAPIVTHDQIPLDIPVPVSNMITLSRTVQIAISRSSAINSEGSYVW